VFGEKIKSLFISSTTKSFQVDVSSLSSGIYFLSAGDLKKKFVIQH